MNHPKFFAVRGMLAATALAIAVMGFRTPYEPIRPEMYARSKILQPARAHAAFAMIPAVKDGTHYEIPLTLVEPRGL